jgi:hypothetical protein
MSMTLAGAGLGAAVGASHALTVKIPDRIRRIKDEKLRKKRIADYRKRVAVAQAIGGGLIGGYIGTGLHRVKRDADWHKKFDEGFYSGRGDPGGARYDWRSQGGFGGGAYDWTVGSPPRKSPSEMWERLGGSGPVPKTKAEVKKAFRATALKYHPDRNPNNPDAAEKMKNLNQEWDEIQKSDWFTKLASFNLFFRFGHLISQG